MARRLLALSLLAACTPAPPPLPGSESLGTYALTATLEPVDGGCPIVWQGTRPAGAQVPLADGGWAAPPSGDGGGGRVDFPAGLEVEATLSRDPASGRTWLTLRGVPREASFDGQVLRTQAAAPRRFPEACDAVLEEDLTLALLSPSQAAAVGEGCPPDALDGGVPAPGAGGIRGPEVTPTGFDAVRACGILVESLQPDGGSACGPCRAVYRVEGSRR